MASELMIGELEIAKKKPTAMLGFWGVVTFVIGYAIFMAKVDMFLEPAKIMFGGFLTLIGISLFWEYAFSELIVTSKRVLYVRGMLFKDSKEILLGKIESVQTGTGFFGFFFGYGDVTVKGSGGTEIRMRDFSGPKKIRDSILEAVESTNKQS